MQLKQLKITWNKKKKNTFGKLLLHFTHKKKKKNTNAIHNLIHTHTHTHTHIYIYIYISSLLTYIMRRLLLNYLLTMLTLKSIQKFNNK